MRAAQIGVHEIIAFVVHREDRVGPVGKQLCEELKIDPREARERLRAAASDSKANPELAKARKPRTPWQWVRGSKALVEAKKALSN